MKESYLTFLIVSVVIGWVWYSDKSDKDDKFIMDCALSMTYQAAIDDGYVVESSGGNNFEIKSIKGKQYVYGYASKPLDLNNLNTTSEEIVNNSYTIRCSFEQYELFGIRIIEKLDESYNWEVMNQESIKDGLVFLSKIGRVDSVTD